MASYRSRHTRKTQCFYCKLTILNASEGLKCYDCKRSEHLVCADVEWFEKDDIQRFVCFRCGNGSQRIERKVIKNSNKVDRYEAVVDRRSEVGTDQFVEDMKLMCYTLSEQIFEVIDGAKLSRKYLFETGFVKPIVVKDGTDIGIKHPEFEAYDDLLNYFSGTDLISVIECRLQGTYPMEFQRFLKHMNLTEDNRRFVLNSLSMKAVSSKEKQLVKLITAPTVVQELCWESLRWSDLSLQEETVSKYVLVSMAKCYIDFHQDFGGTSVWYRVISGRKRFILIDPKEENVMALRALTFDDDRFDFIKKRWKDCYSIVLTAGDTILMPSGYIHAVITEEDSIVIAGNFLCSLHLDSQLSINDHEISTRAGKKYTFPNFDSFLVKSLSAVAEDYEYLKSLNVITRKQMEGLLSYVQRVNNIVRNTNYKEPLDLQEFEVFMDKLKYLLSQLRETVNEPSHVGPDNDLDAAQVKTSSFDVSGLSDVNHENNTVEYASEAHQSAAALKADIISKSSACDICDRVFTGLYCRQSLHRHLKVHSTGLVSAFACSKCKATFSRQDHLSQHKCEGFKCQRCKTQFKWLQSYKRHVTQCGAAVVGFECSCGSVFNRKDNLVKHQRKLGHSDR